jgi:serine/threonine protein kinase
VTNLILFDWDSKDNALLSKIQREIVYRSRQLRYSFQHPGKVYLVYDNKTFDLLVAKKISMEGLSHDETERTMREIEIHKNLGH